MSRRSRSSAEAQDETSEVDPQRRASPQFAPTGNCDNMPSRQMSATKAHAQIGGH